MKLVPFPALVHSGQGWAGFTAIKIDGSESGPSPIHQSSGSRVIILLGCRAVRCAEEPTGQIILEKLFGTKVFNSFLVAIAALVVVAIVEVSTDKVGVQQLQFGGLVLALLRGLVSNEREGSGRSCIFSYHRLDDKSL